MWTKLGSKLQKKKIEMRTSGGGGGSSVISDTPGRGGEGVKKVQIFADVLYGWPLTQLIDLWVVKSKTWQVSNLNLKYRSIYNLKYIYYKCIYALSEL